MSVVSALFEEADDPMQRRRSLKAAKRIASMIPSATRADKDDLFDQLAELAHQERISSAQRSGPGGALSVLVEAIYRDRLVHSFLRSQSGGGMQQDEQIEEVVQEALATITKEIGKFRPRTPLQRPGRFKAWLFDIAVKRRIDLYRKRSSEMVMVDLPDQGGGRYSSAVVNQDAIRAALDDLPARYRQVLELQYLEGLPPEKIEERLDITNNQFRGLQNRAGKRLREALEARRHER